MPGVSATREFPIGHHLLTNARKHANLSQEALASLSGVSRATIGFIERYNHNPGLNLKLNIAMALGLEVIDLWPDEPIRCQSSTPRNGALLHD